MFLLPESPRYFIKHGNIEKAACVLSRLRGQSQDSDYIIYELAEIRANHEVEMQVTPPGCYARSWLNCFKGSIWKTESNLRRTILGTSLQMMQQATGVNFIFYFSTTFFENLHLGINSFLFSLTTMLVNVLSTPISFWTVEKFGRRPLLIWGALGMMISQLIVAVAGTVTFTDPKVNKVEIAFVCIFIFCFASTWGPGAWIVVGEVFSLPIRSRGVALSTASNWLWNAVIAAATPAMVDALGIKVFFVWGSLCGGCLVYAYMLVPETKGLTLEQVNRMLEESNPRTSNKWRPMSISLYTARKNKASTDNLANEEKKEDKGKRPVDSDADS